MIQFISLNPLQDFYALLGTIIIIVLAIVIAISLVKCTIESRRARKNSRRSLKNQTELSIAMLEGV
jgi:hypothetical protein